MKKKHYSMNNYRLDESVGFLLQQASNEVERRLSAELKKKCPESTAAQWKILMLLGNKKCKNAAELAAIINCDMGSITRMLDRLEAKGLIQRERSKADRRIVNLSLTGFGDELFPHLPEASVNMMNRLLKDFTATEVADLKLLLRRIIAAGD
ncbi:MAG: MarR family transcriptional regulator [Deltaproteobacteria bacterium]|nr:MarR family transcriptional regulator [Deltaproteobacteria bacterium]